MPLTEQDVHYVAELAHLELTPQEVANFLPQLDAILQYMQQLNELDTSKVEPMAQVTNPAAEAPALRSAQPMRSLNQDEALANAPERNDAYFKVPRVIERE